MDSKAFPKASTCARYSAHVQVVQGVSFAVLPFQWQQNAKHENKWLMALRAKIYCKHYLLVRFSSGEERAYLRIEQRLHRSVA